MYKNPKIWYYLGEEGKKIPCEAWYLDNQQVISCFYCLHSNRKEKSCEDISESCFTTGIRPCNRTHTSHLPPQCSLIATAAPMQILPWTTPGPTMSWLYCVQCWTPTLQRKEGPRRQLLPKLASWKLIWEFPPGKWNPSFGRVHFQFIISLPILHLQMRQSFRPVTSCTKHNQQGLLGLAVTPWPTVTHPATCICKMSWRDVDISHMLKSKDQHQEIFKQLWHLTSLE